MKNNPIVSSNLMSKAPSNRQQRVSEEIRQILAGIIARGDFYTPELRERSITITNVSVSPDLKNALVFVMPLGGEEKGKTISLLKKCQKEFRYLMAKELQLRHVPNLRFEIDDSYEYVDKMNQLFAKIGTFYRTDEK